MCTIFIATSYILTFADDDKLKLDSSIAMSRYSRQTSNSERNYVVFKSIELGIESINLVSAELRSIQGLTFSLTYKQLHFVESKIEELHKDINGNLENWDNNSLLMSLNTQLVPLTKFDSCKLNKDDRVHYSDASIKFPQWVNTVVRELLGLAYYECDPYWIQEKLIPYISLEDIKKSINFLEKQNMIAYDPINKKYFCVKENILTAQEVQGKQIIQFHNSMIQNAKEIASKVNYKNCHFLSSTSLADFNGISKAKGKIIETIKDVLTQDQEFGDGEIVYQLNLQYFPLVK